MTAIAIPARRRYVLVRGKPLGLTDEQIDATVVGDSGDPPGQIATRDYEFASANYDARVTGKREPEQDSEGESE